MIDDRDLLPGETVVWEGEPAVAWWIARADLPLMLAVPVASWAGVALFVFLSPSGSLPTPAKVFLWTAVAIAALYNLSYPLRRQLLLERTRYALTTQRIFVEEGLLKARRLYQLSRLGSPHLRLGEQGVGSIAMGGFPNPLAERVRRRFLHSAGPQGWPPPVLWNIPDAERVNGLIDTYWRASVTDAKVRSRLPPSHVDGQPSEG